MYFPQVCDEPHPLLIREMIKSCTTGEIDEAYKVLSHLWYMGYSPEDIITNIFRVCKTFQMAEYLKLEFIKVEQNSSKLQHVFRVAISASQYRISKL